MINNSNNVDKAKTDPKKVEQTKKPNETGGVYFSSHVKIFDPNTKEVFLNKRADD